MILNKFILQCSKFQSLDLKKGNLKELKDFQHVFRIRISAALLSVLLLWS